MLQVNFIRENKDVVINGMKKRNFTADDLKIIDQIIELDDTRKHTQTELDALITRLTPCTGTCDAQRTRTVVKASCAAVLGSAVMLLQ